MSTAFRDAGALPRVRSYSPADWITGPLTSQYVVGATLAVGLMLWSAGIVIAAIDLVKKRASEPFVAQIAGLRDEVDLLAERVEEATTAAAIIRRATGQPVHPVPDLPDDGS